MFNMRFWFVDRVNQRQFKIYWRTNKLNLADFFTKHHLTSHHQKMRPIYLTENKNKKNILWHGCVSRIYSSPDDIERLAQIEPLQAQIAHMSQHGMLSHRRSENNSLESHGSKDS